MTSGWLRDERNICSRPLLDADLSSSGGGLWSRDIESCWILAEQASSFTQAVRFCPVSYRNGKGIRGGPDTSIAGDRPSSLYGEPEHLANGGFVGVVGKFP